MKFFWPIWRGPALLVQRPGPIVFKLGRGQVAATIELGQEISLKNLITKTSLTFGEAYMNGSLDIRGDLKAVLQAFYLNCTPPLRMLKKMRFLTRPTANMIAASIANARHHYDIGTNFYKLWLDSSLTYSCAYFPTGRENIAEAQLAKRELICRKLDLKEPNLTILDIGCGWGSLLFHLAENYNVIVTGLTPSRDQASYIEAETARRRLANRVKVIVGDWRDAALSSQAFDRVVSVGMFEHVGPHNYSNFFRRWHQLLKSGGLSLLHTIGHTRVTSPDPWITKYIFPGGYLPTANQIRKAVHKAKLEIPAGHVNNLPTWHNLKPHYAHTLKLWSQNFAAHKKQIVTMFDDRFYRMWWLYLKASEAGFRWGDLQLYQAILRHK